MKIKFVFFILAFFLVFIPLWYFDPFHDSVEDIDTLVGMDYKNGRNSYFYSDPDDSTQFNINEGVPEFRVGVLANKSILRDSIIKEYTWIFPNHKVTIWVARTDNYGCEIVDAIRYKNGVVF